MLGTAGRGNHIYRVGYDGKTGQMDLLEDVAETTGMGLGVHTVPFPDGTGFACGDGQKDIVAFFSRARGEEKTTVLNAFRAVPAEFKSMVAALIHRTIVDRSL